MRVSVVNFEQGVFVDQASAGSELAVQVPGPAGELAAIVTRASAGGVLLGKGYVAVVCHPHPQHGGTMNNKVVTTLVRSYRDLGVPVVRFNFRGVGGSEGVYDEARGEVDDALAIVEWVSSVCSGSNLLLAGFSFGSAVAAAASFRLSGVLGISLAHLTLVAPPVERYSYDQDGRFPCSVCVIQGGKDELVDVPGVYRWVDGLESEVSLIRFDEASHFFHGALVDFKRSFVGELEGLFG